MKNKKVMRTMMLVLIVLLIILGVIVVKKSIGSSNEKYQSEVEMQDEMKSEEMIPEIESGDCDVLEENESSQKESVEPEKL